MKMYLKDWFDKAEIGDHLLFHLGCIITAEFDMIKVSSDEVAVSFCNQEYTRCNVQYLIAKPVEAVDFIHVKEENFDIKKAAPVISMGRIAGRAVVVGCLCLTKKKIFDNLKIDWEAF